MSFAEWLSGCDLAVYNSDNFGVPKLVEEFARVGIDFSEECTGFLDGVKIERNVNSHCLEETYHSYTGQSRNSAHDALSDIRATFTIFEKQLEQNPNLPTIPDLEELCRGDNVRVHFAGKLCEKEGLICWSFGKYRDRLVTETRDYANWVLGGDFPSETKKQVRQLLNPAMV